MPPGRESENVIFARDIITRGSVHVSFYCACHCYYFLFGNRLCTLFGFLSSLFDLNHVPVSDILYTENDMSVIFICDLMHTTIALTQA